jgi:hypothetical protein
MSGTWLSIRVELVAGGGGEPLWPRPGRVLRVRPSMTFGDLARAIDTAFGRWDASPLHRFVLADGTWLKPNQPHDAPDGGDDAAAQLSRLADGEQFLYEFDLDERWQHLCTVADVPVEQAADPDVGPQHPHVTAGWGSIPDQHRRYWEHDPRDGSLFPEAPDPPLSDLPQLDPWWELGLTLPEPGEDFPLRGAPYYEDPHLGVELGLWHNEAVHALRTALTRKDDESLFWVLISFDPVKVAHRCAPALLRITNARVPRLVELIGDIIAGLHERGWAGDVALAHQLQHALTGEPIPGRPRRSVPVDVETVAAILSSPADPHRTWTLDVPTGRLLAPGVGTAASTAAPDAEADAAAPDAEADAGADGRPDGDALPDRIAITGLGPLPLEEDVQVVARAVGFSLAEDLSFESSLLLDERRLGRARGWLDDAGIAPC